MPNKKQRHHEQQHELVKTMLSTRRLIQIIIVFLVVETLYTDGGIHNTEKPRNDVEISPAELMLMQSHEFCPKVEGWGEPYKKKAWGYWYRLSDFYKETPGAGEIKRNIDCDSSKFSKRILCDYSRRMRNHSDLVALNEVITERYRQDYRKTAPLPRGTSLSLVIHVRIGDVILGKDAWHDSSQVRHHSHNGPYAFGSRCWEYLLEYLPEHRPVVLVGSAGHGNARNQEYSSNYIHELESLFTSKGYHVCTRLHGSPDADTIFISMAHHYLSTNGGFSRMFDSIVDLRGGEVLGNWFRKKCRSLNWGFSKKLNWGFSNQSITVPRSHLKATASHPSSMGPSSS